MITASNTLALRSLRTGVRTRGALPRHSESQYCERRSGPEPEPWRRAAVPWPASAPHPYQEWNVIMGDMRGKVGIVTGAGSGIGLATVRTLISKGARVVGADLNTSALEEIEGVLPVGLDVTSPGAGERLVGTTAETFGRVDALVNSAGGQLYREAGFLGVSDEDWWSGLQLNLMGAVRCCRAALPHLVERGGSIVNVGSISAREPHPFAPDYAAAKAALLSLTKTISMEFGSRGVRCNLVAPGPTSTPVFERWLQELASASGRSVEEEAAEFVKVRRRMALSQIGTPTDVAAVIGFLVSDEARQVTGSEYRVDGGAVQSIL